MYHGNDGTTFAWNDTAQLDYSKAEVREHVIQVILDVARRFPIIRFDAAMVLAKRHVQRLWFPLPGAGGSIPSRAEDAISDEAFNELMPHEFWREVVDRVAVEVPGTLLLAEAFWLLESYFVRTLGMHRVYNSAFMNMLRDEENAKYRSYLKKTVEFDPDILKRYVNFMSNPDEKTAVDQFGTGDKYFGVSVLLATLPGLPMFGHGQVEGYTERYGMDFKQARLDEQPNADLVARHQQLLAPLLKNRQLFAESTNFVMYDFWTGHGDVDENVFAYSNTHGDQRAIILYNNRYGATYGTIKTSVAFLEKQSGSLRQKDLSEGLRLPYDDETILAYRDTVQGLEYLRRARDVRDHGLTLELRGYQHVVLLNWRELQSSEAYPWDRLCDALNGSGVYSVDEALSHLRLLPLVDSLRRVINETNIQHFSKAAHETFTREQKAGKTKDVQASAKKTKAKAPAKTLPPASEARPTFEAPDFIAGVKAFSETALGLANHAEQLVAAEKESGTAAGKVVTYSTLVTASVNLPTLVLKFPEPLQVAARSVLPSKEVKDHFGQVWAPILAWIAARAFTSPATSLAIYDELHLRHAFAETFSSVGVNGEQAWRAAAQVRVLLSLNTQPSVAEATRSESFWQDPDVRWLTGVHSSGDIEFFEKERFDAFVCWIQLPIFAAGSDESLQTKAVDDAVASAGQLADAAKRATYNVRAFLDDLRPAISKRGNAATEKQKKAPVAVKAKKVTPVAEKPKKAAVAKKQTAKTKSPKTTK
jgi:hypothetical protein